MANHHFSFKQFTVRQEKCAMKVCTDACLFGALAAAAVMPEIKSILDIGAGTGLLSLMLAQQSDADIQAVEIDENAFLQCTENFANSPWSNRLKVHHRDIREFEADSPFDFIISNPPFFEGDLRSPDEAANRARHDSTLKLQELTSCINRLLHPEAGSGAIMIPPFREDILLDYLRMEGLFPAKIIRVRQMQEQEPFRSMVFLARKEKNKIMEVQMHIMDADNRYSAEFSALLANYYLYL